jgi:hypothetical protein
MTGFRKWRDVTGVEYTLHRTSGGTWCVLSVDHDPRPVGRTGLFNKREVPPPFSPGSAVWGVPDEDY